MFVQGRTCTGGTNGVLQRFIGHASEVAQRFTSGSQRFIYSVIDSKLLSLISEPQTIQCEPLGCPIRMQRKCKGSEQKRTGMGVLPRVFCLLGLLRIRALLAMGESLSWSGRQMYSVHIRLRHNA